MAATRPASLLRIEQHGSVEWDDALTPRIVTVAGVTVTNPER
jgi:hypothetical protein